VRAGSNCGSRSTKAVVIAPPGRRPASCIAVARNTGSSAVSVLKTIGTALSGATLAKPINPPTRLEALSEYARRLGLCFQNPDCQLFNPSVAVGNFWPRTRRSGWRDGPTWQALQRKVRCPSEGGGSRPPAVMLLK